MHEVTSAAIAIDQEPDVKVINLTGEGPKAFAAGADIKEMAEKSYSEVGHVQEGIILFKKTKQKRKCEGGHVFLGFTGYSRVLPAELQMDTRKGTGCKLPCD